MQDIDINEVRLLYKQASKNRRKCDELYAKLDVKEVEQHPVFLGYKGAAQAIRAKHSIFPHLKYTRFRDAMSILDRAIIKDAHSAELRFLRFTIQTNSPAIFNYKGQIQEDKKMMTDALPQVQDDAGLIEVIATALLESDAVTNADKDLAKEYLDKLQ
ncbi:hypothetical protein BKI52_00525 [marine bacterium AO1-C]|nr:hypothetical protein BKI52_00525 [marine bacterium AO1-C]